MKRNRIRSSDGERRLLHGLLLPLLIIVIGETSAVAAKDWDANGGIEVTITSPATGDFVCRGDTLTCTASASDSDHWVERDEEGNVTDEGNEYDILAYFWSGNGGSFPNGNTGSSVVWKAPQLPGPVTISVTVDDPPGPHVPGGDTGSRDDTVAPKLVNVVVIKVDLVIQSLPEETEPAPNEEDPGAFIGVNNDDDNNNGAPDKEENGTVTGENDLTELRIVFGPSWELDSGTLKLEATSGGTAIKVWTDSTKGTEVELPKTWAVGTDSILARLYVEGMTASGGMRDIELKLTYTATSGVVCDDSAKATVVGVNLVVQNLPEETQPPPNEEDPGAFVPFNDDDDNNNGVLDKDESAVVTGEDDLVPLTISLLPAGLDSGALRLEAAAGGSKVKVWTDATKGTEVPLPKTWQVGTDTIPADLYVEGIAASGAEGDVKLRLVYTATNGVASDDSVKATVAKVDLIIQGLPEETEPTPNEEDPGAFIGLNKDDDNNNTIPDKDETGTVDGEDDLVAISLSVQPTLSTGTVKLEATSGGSKVKVWESAAKGTEATLPKTWDLANEPAPWTLYVEGYATSGSERDVELKLTWTSGAIIYDDKVKATVVKVDLVIQGLPEEAGPTPNEEDPGAFVGLNKDDDNNNTTPDKDESEAVDCYVPHYLA